MAAVSAWGFTLARAAAQHARLRAEMARIQEEMHKEIRHWQEDAPSRVALSPWKYSLNTRLSRQAGSSCRRETAPKQGRRPSAPRTKIEMSRSWRSAATRSRVSW